MTLKNKKNIVLTGFMGSGKSTVGKLLSKEIAYDFVDMDKEIERISNQSISSIFEKNGESAFRDLESSVCLALSKKTSTVIATGGGVIKRKENIFNLKKNSFIVFLNASDTHILNNLKQSTDRPLLQSENEEDRLALINKLLGERTSAYEENADFIVDVTGKKLEQITDEIVKLFF